MHNRLPNNLNVKSCARRVKEGDGKVWSVAFNFVSPQHRDIFASVGGNRVPSWSVEITCDTPQLRLPRHHGKLYALAAAKRTHCGCAGVHLQV